MAAIDIGGKTIKVLSLLQPWASLVIIGAKKIETRSWSSKYRGPLLIHASMGKAGALIAAQPPFTAHISSFKALPFGAIIGQVDIVDIVKVPALGMLPEILDELTLEEKAFGDYTTGRYAWLLANPQQLDEPIPATGRLGLWEF